MLYTELQNFVSDANWLFLRSHHQLTLIVLEIKIFAVRGSSSLPFIVCRGSCPLEFMSSELRAKLQGLLGVRCVFPNNSGATDSDFTVRCMLENSSGGKALLYKDSIEDVIVRLKSLTSIETDEDRAIRIKVRGAKMFSPDSSLTTSPTLLFLHRKSNTCSRDCSPTCKLSLVCRLPRRSR